MKTITLKTDGRFEHLWLANIHKDIPVNAIEVTDEVFVTLSQDPTNKIYDVETESVSEFVAPFNFDLTFSAKLNEIRLGFIQAMRVITDTYTAEDIASFPTQEAEANAWQANSTASTPFIDGLLAERPSVDKATLVQRIIANAIAYKSVAGPTIGKKQAYEDQVYQLQLQQNDPLQADVTQSDFDAIVVSFE